MKKSIFYLSAACIVLFAQSCSTSEFASHIHRSDMVRVDKNKSSERTIEAKLERTSIKNEKIIETPSNNLLEGEILATSTVAVPSLTLQKEEKMQTASEVVSSSKVLEQKFASKKEFRKEVRKMKQEYRSKSLATDDMQLLIIILAIILPPVGVLLYDGGVETPFWISLILTLLMWLPGAIYSLLYVTGNI